MGFIQVFHGRLNNVPLSPNTYDIQVQIPKSVNVSLFGGRDSVFAT